jgi:hypothetical protein
MKVLQHDGMMMPKHADDLQTTSSIIKSCAKELKARDG